MIRVAWQVAGQVASYGSSYGASASYISEPAQLPGPWLAPKCAMKTVVCVWKSLIHLFLLSMELINISHTHIYITFIYICIDIKISYLYARRTFGYYFGGLMFLIDFIHICICICVYMYSYVFMYMHMYICICICIYDVCIVRMSIPLWQKPWFSTTGHLTPRPSLPGMEERRGRNEI